MAVTTQVYMYVTHVNNGADCQVLGDIQAHSGHEKSLLSQEVEKEPGASHVDVADAQGETLARRDHVWQLRSWHSKARRELQGSGSRTCTCFLVPHAN